MLITKNMTPKKVKRLRKRILRKNFYRNQYCMWLGEWHALFNMSPAYWELLNWEQVDRKANRIKAEVNWYKTKLSSISQQRKARNNV